LYSKLDELIPENNKLCLLFSWQDKQEKFNSLVWTFRKPILYLHLPYLFVLNTCTIICRTHYIISEHIIRSHESSKHTIILLLCRCSFCVSLKFNVCRWEPKLRLVVDCFLLNYKIIIFVKICRYVGGQLTQFQ